MTKVQNQEVSSGGQPLFNDFQRFVCVLVPPLSLSLHLSDNNYKPVTDLGSKTNGRCLACQEN